jgi:prephenate dehydrogenase
MKDLGQITVVGLGLLGGSITLGALRSFSGVRVVGYSHRGVTRRKARELAVAGEIVDDLVQSVRGSDIVILATPIYTFDEIFKDISGALKDGCIVTDVGSTKVLSHRWASKRFGKSVHYVGSHPIAGSEQRGVEFARDDLFDQAICVVTATKSSDKKSVKKLGDFWTALGARVTRMTPSVHDRIFANISHVPHLAAAALLNSNRDDELAFAGSGFMDTSRIASGPANIWTDIALSNSVNLGRGIDRLIAELNKLKAAIKAGDQKKVEMLLEKARARRAGLINRKLKRKEILP